MRPGGGKTTLKVSEEVASFAARVIFPGLPDRGLPDELLSLGPQTTNVSAVPDPDDKVAEEGVLREEGVKSGGVDRRGREDLEGADASGQHGSSGGLGVSFLPLVMEKAVARLESSLTKPLVSLERSETRVQSFKEA